MSNIELLKNRAKELMTTEHDFIDSIAVELTTDEKYGWQDGQRLGKYDPLKKRITLFDVFRNSSMPEIVADSIFPTYMHELCHALQHRECGTVGYLLMLGLCRWKLEKDAREIEDSFYKFS
jgi:hypothetical protein